MLVRWWPLMPGIDTLLAFAQITFPVLLLGPPLFVSLQLQFPLAQLAGFWLAIVLQFLTYVSLIAYEFIGQRYFLPFAYLMVSSLMVGFSIYLLLRWTMRTQIGLWFNIWSGVRPARN